VIDDNLIKSSSFPKKRGIFDTDEVAEATIDLTEKSNKHSILEGKELCQGVCKSMHPKTKLRFLQETHAHPINGDDILTMFRFCETCCEIYGDDRNAVVPKSHKNFEIKSVVIKNFT
jgi:hypothetical protein